MYESGAYVSAHLEPVGPEQVQPNGVDLTLAAVAVQTSSGRLARDGKTVGDREPVEPTPAAEAPGDPDGPVYELEPGGYVATYAETIAVPDGHVGFVYPRSSLMRNGAMLNTAVWDAGYEGRGEGLLQVNAPIEIEVGARFAQFVMATAEHEDTYDGSYQGERIED